MNEFFKYFNAMMKLTANVVDFTIEVTYAIIFCFRQGLWPHSDIVFNRL